MNSEKHLREVLLTWIHRWGVNYKFTDPDNHHGAGFIVDVNDLMKKIKPFLRQEKHTCSHPTCTGEKHSYFGGQSICEYVESVRKMYCSYKEPTKIPPFKISIIPQIEDHQATYLRENLEKKLEEFKQKALAKFDRGRAEHGDDLSQIDYDKEINDELMDIIIYRAMREMSI